MTVKTQENYRSDFVCRLLQNVLGFCDIEDASYTLYRKTNTFIDSLSNMLYYVLQLVLTLRKIDQFDMLFRFLFYDFTTVTSMNCK